MRIAGGGSDDRASQSVGRAEQRAGQGGDEGDRGAACDRIARAYSSAM